MFPGFGKLTRTYFLRVALWMKVFLQRGKFESGGVTSAGTGVASASILVAFAGLILGFGGTIVGQIGISVTGYTLGALFFLVYLYGYLGFFGFMLRENPCFLPIGLVLNIYFTLVIASGALFGLTQGLLGQRVNFKFQK